jgi:molybdenum cofactor cytidylyltransferase
MIANISAIILAAGKSQRMGQPKMLLPWGDTTVLGQVTMTFSKAGIADIIVVTGGDRDAVEAEVSRLSELLSVRSVYNPYFEQTGMMSSIQVGLASISANCKAVLIGLGDQPQVEDKTLKDILSLYEKKGAGIIVPSHKNRRGHPVFVGVVHRPELVNFHPQSSLRDFLNKHPSEIYYVDASASVLQDLDTPQDYQNFQGNLTPRE